MKEKLNIYGLKLIGFLVAILSIFPLIWMAMAGFKKESEVLSYPFKFFPSEWILTNYIELLQNPAFMRSIGLTLFVAVVATTLIIFINSMAAYVFARLEFPTKNFWWLYVIMTLFIPSMAILIPSYIVVAKLHMLNTIYVLIIPGIASAMNVFLIRQFYLNIPTELEDAAFIDGANRFKIYWYIFLPLSVPVFVLVGITAFLGYWNSLIWPIMTISDERLYQIMQLLAYFRSDQGNDWAMIMAGSTIAAIPVIVLFLIFQRHLIEGIKISGIK
ncbi:carbohydrate ABC transporter permease [Virgibacillus ndiopensis]|uniref:carbohydrate ABC transporter permease n=1 Tax=Virgibacillus ndiopensis TaxID=2004408 RepID=UPI000C088DCE|nr:carbohydrate ABC transporter permease [Virgibacillus ndiopensis]